MKINGLQQFYLSQDLDVVSGSGKLVTLTTISCKREKYRIEKSSEVSMDFVKHNTHSLTHSLPAFYDHVNTCMATGDSVDIWIPEKHLRSFHTKSFHRNKVAMLIVFRCGNGHFMS